MLKKLCAIIAIIGFLYVLSSGILVNIAEFISWLFFLNVSQPETSLVGGIIVRLLTFATSYSLVGLLFKAIGWFNSKFMSIVYLIASTILGFVFAYTIWKIEENAIPIIIGAGILSVFAIVLLIILSIKNKKNDKNIEVVEEK